MSGTLLDFGDDPSPVDPTQVEVTASDPGLDPFDPFSGSSDTKAAGAESSPFDPFDPFGASPLSPESLPSMDDSLSERDQRAFEAQFDDLLGDMNGSASAQELGDDVTTGGDVKAGDDFTASGAFTTSQNGDDPGAAVTGSAVTDPFASDPFATDPFETNTIETHDDKENKGTTATSPITIATSDRDQQENGYEANSLTSQSLSPLPSELTHSMNMGLEEGIGDFPDTAAPYAQMEEDLEETEEDVSLGQDLVEDDNMVDESPNDPIKYFTTSITADDEDDDVIAGCNVVITESEDVDKFAEEKQPAEYVDDGSSDLAIHVTEPSSEEEENDSDHEAENPDDDAIKSPDADLDKSPDEAREADDIDDTAVTRDTADTDTVTDTADTQVAMESDDPVPDGQDEADVTSPSTNNVQEIPATETGNKEDKTMVDCIKDRFANKPQDLLPQKITREPKKLDRQWSKQGEEGSLDSPTRKTPGMEQEMLQYTGYAGVGVDYSKAKYQSQISKAESGPLSPTSPRGQNANLIPVNWQTVEKVAAPEITKNVRARFESGEVAKREVKKSFNREFKPPAESGTFENEPSELDETVVRGGEMEDEQQKPQAGATRQKLSDWKVKGSQSTTTSRGPINVAEDAGCVLESQPQVRDDVTRETDEIGTNGLPEQGKAKNMLNHWTTMNDNQPKQKRPAIKLVEKDEGPAIYENQPSEVPEGVVRGEDYTDDVKLEPGQARNLQGYWAGVSDDKATQREAVKIDYESGPVIRENQPTVREDVVRESDTLQADRNLTLQAGHARNVASNFLEKDTGPGERKQPIDLDTSSGPVVTENEPAAQQEHVIRGGDYSTEVRTEAGHTRNIRNVFANPEDKWANRQREKIQIDTSSAPQVVENEPMQLDDSVVRGGDAGMSVDINSGRTRNMLDVWAVKEADANTVKTSSTMVDGKPVWTREIEVAKDSGVYENEPMVREDVVKHDEMEPDMVPAHKATNMRNMWTTREEEEERRLQKERTPECVRFTPPREMTPPSVHRPSLHSFQTMTLSSGQQMNGDVQQNGHQEEEDAEFTMETSASMDADFTMATDSYSPTDYTDQGMDYSMQPPPSETVKTSTTLRLMQS